MGPSHQSMVRISGVLLPNILLIKSLMLPTALLHYWKCNFTMTPRPLCPSYWLVGRLVGLSQFPKRAEFYTSQLLSKHLFCFRKLKLRKVLHHTESKGKQTFEISDSKLSRDFFALYTNLVSRRALILGNKN